MPKAGLPFLIPYRYTDEDEYEGKAKDSQHDACQLPALVEADAEATDELDNPEENPSQPLPNADFNLSDIAEQGGAEWLPKSPGKSVRWSAVTPSLSL